MPLVLLFLLIMDLDFIKKNSKKIVEKAFEKEKINWQGFIHDFKNPLMKLSFSS